MNLNILLICIMLKFHGVSKAGLNVCFRFWHVIGLMIFNINFIWGYFHYRIEHWCLCQMAWIQIPFLILMEDLEEVTLPP